MIHTIKLFSLENVFPSVASALKSETDNNIKFYLDQRSCC